MATNSQSGHPLSKVCLFFECQGYYISDFDHDDSRDKEFILRELGYSHWFLTSDRSGSWMYSVDMEFEDLAPHNQFDIQHRIEHEHGLVFEDICYEGLGSTLRPRNNVSRDIVKLYNTSRTDSRDSIAYKGYETGQLLKNVSDIIPVIDLDMFDFSEEVVRPKRCDCHLMELHCCRQSCAHYAEMSLMSQWSLPDGLESDLIHNITSHLEQIHIDD